MKICIATAAIGKKYQYLCAPGIRSKRRYAHKHGYDFVYHTASLDPSRPPAWSKILLVHKLLPHYDWVFWIDADTFIMNDQTRIETLIKGSYEFIGSSPNPAIPINTGSFLIKNTPLMSTFLTDIYSRTEYIHHCWWENAAFAAVLEKANPYQKHIEWVHTKTMNSSHPEIRLHGNTTEEALLYKKGDFILHLSGERNMWLFMLMRKYGWKKPFFVLLLSLAKASFFVIGAFHPKSKKAYHYFQQLSLSTKP